jgi:hypothetical protein
LARYGGSFGAQKTVLRHLSAVPKARADVQPQAYGLMARWVHRLALEPIGVRQLSFAAERMFEPKGQKSVQIQQGRGVVGAGPVYVCGLARSGTTMLLRILAEVPGLQSLRYRDMPFVLAPRLWALLTQSAPRHVERTVRAHGDGIEIDLDSPEAFEEVFWRTFALTADDDDCLRAEEPGPETMAAFAHYRRLVAHARPGKDAPRRYLSKNNNNLLRMDVLATDPEATVLVVYRHPLATAWSLHRQHAHFCAAQLKDPFVRDYMRWLGHYEFGLDHRPFSFARPAMPPSLAPGGLDYWLAYWKAVYDFVLAQAHPRVRFLNHDELRARPGEMVAALLRAIQADGDPAILARPISAPQTSVLAGSHSQELLAGAAATHAALLVSPHNIWC